MQHADIFRRYDMYQGSRLQVSNLNKIWLERKEIRM